MRNRTLTSTEKFEIKEHLYKISVPICPTRCVLSPEREAEADKVKARGSRFVFCGLIFYRLKRAKCGKG